MDKLDRLEMMWNQTEFTILKNLIKQLKDLKKIDENSEHWTKLLNLYGYDSEQIQKLVDKALSDSQKTADELIQEVADDTNDKSEQLAKKRDTTFVKTQIDEGIRDNLKTDINNLSNTLGFVKMQAGKVIFSQATQYFNDLIDKAMLDMIAGVFDYNTLVEKTATELAKSGIRTIDYESGRTIRLPAGIRRIIMTTQGQVAGKINEANAEKLGTDYFEVSRHADSRDTHRAWQGKVFSKEELETVCGLGTKTGLAGINCRHDYFPFIKGISERAYTDKELEELNEKESIKKEWKGKTYDSYEQTQKMRAYENNMRISREKIRLLQEMGVDDKIISKAKTIYNNQKQQYRAFCKQMERRPQWERVKFDGLGRI